MYVRITTSSSERIEYAQRKFSNDKTNTLIQKRHMTTALGLPVPLFGSWIPTARKYLHILPEFRAASIPSDAPPTRPPDASPAQRQVRDSATTPPRHRNAPPPPDLPHQPQHATSASQHPDPPLPTITQFAFNPFGKFRRLNRVAAALHRFQQNSIIFQYLRLHKRPIASLCSFAD